MQGSDSLRASQIQGLNGLKVNGNSALDNASIISEAPNESTFVAIINGMFAN